MSAFGVETTSSRLEFAAKGEIKEMNKKAHTCKTCGKVTESAGHLCDQLDEIGHRDPVFVVLDRSPFYGESGGQVGDQGKLVGDGFEFEVTDTQKDGDLLLHVGHLRRGTMQEGAHIEAVVDSQRRQAIRRAHSATHILHFALQQHVGTHAQQQGSKVEEDWLRFDFTNLSPVTEDQLRSASTGSRRAACSAG